MRRDGVMGSSKMTDHRAFCGKTRTCMLLACSSGRGPVPLADTIEKSFQLSHDGASINALFFCTQGHGPFSPVSLLVLRTVVLGSSSTSKSTVQCGVFMVVSP